MTRTRIRRSAGTSAGGGIAIAGLVLGYLALVLQVLAIVFIVVLGLSVDSVSSDVSVRACRTESDTLVTAANVSELDGGSSTPQDYLIGSLTYFELDGSRTTATLDQVSAFDCPAVDIGG